MQSYATECSSIIHDKRRKTGKVLGTFAQWIKAAEHCNKDLFKTRCPVATQRVFLLGFISCIDIYFLSWPNAKWKCRLWTCVSGRCLCTLCEMFLRSEMPLRIDRILKKLAKIDLLLKDQQSDESVTHTNRKHGDRRMFNTSRNFHST